MGLITCASCGARYDDKEKVCPYCGAENAAVSVKEQMDYLAAMEEKKNRLNDEVPRQKTKRALTKITKGGMVVAGLFVVFALLAAGASILAARQRRAFQQEALETLEGYYVRNDYDSMLEYMEKHDDLYSATYDKYDYLSEVYYYYQSGKEYLEEDLSFLEKNSNYTEGWSENLGMDISYLFRALSILRDLEEDGYVYNEESGVLYLRDLILPVLRDTCMLTESEIQEGIERYEGFNTDYADYGEMVLGRVI